MQCSHFDRKYYNLCATNVSSLLVEGKDQISLKESKEMAKYLSPAPLQWKILNIYVGKKDIKKWAHPTSYKNETTFCLSSLFWEQPRRVELYQVSDFGCRISFQSPLKGSHFVLLYPSHCSILSHPHPHTLYFLVSYFLSTYVQIAKVRRYRT